MKFKKGMKIMTLTAIAVIFSMSLTSCSLFNKQTTETLASSAPATVTPAPVSDEEAIIGKWSIENFLDKNGENVSTSDIDLTDTPLDGMSSIFETFLKKGSTIEFKEDKTIPLVVTKGEYSINGSKLKLSLPDFSQSGEFDFDIDGNEMTINLYDYKLVLKKK